MDKPTRPAGCFLQLIGGALAIYATMNVAFEDYDKVIIFGAIGLALLFWGRKATT